MIFETQKALYQALINDAALMQLIKVVTDNVKEKQAYPYVQIGEFRGEPSNTFDKSRIELNWDINIFTNKESKKQGILIQEEVRRLFKTTPIAENCEIVNMELIDIDSDIVNRHNVITMSYRILIKEV